MVEHPPNLRELLKHRESPFIGSLFIRKTDKRRKSGIKYGAFDQGTGEVMDNMEAREVVYQEYYTEQFVKVYEDFLSDMFELSPRALKVLRYFMTALKFGEHQVLYNPREAKEVTGYVSNASIAVALAELVIKDVIARSEMPSIFFIDPKCFFKGDRIDIHKTYVRANSAASNAARAPIEAETERAKQLSLFDREQEEGLPAAIVAARRIEQQGRDHEDQ